MIVYNLFALTETPDKSVQEIAEEVLADKWGTGAERKARLTAAGYDYQEVQKAVNALLADAETLADAPDEIPNEITGSIDVIVRTDGKTYSGTLTESHC